MNNGTCSFSNVNELDVFILKENIQDASSLLIQLFSATTKLDKIIEIQAYFQEKFPNATFIGTTTDGIIDSDRVLHDGSKSVATFTFFEFTKLRSVLLHRESDDKSSFFLGERVAKHIFADDIKVVISFADGVNTNGDEYAKGINSILPDVILSGGLAADNGEFIQTYVFDKYEIIDNGAVAVSLSSRHLHAITDYSFDWFPIGKSLIVTKAIGNRVYEIDGLTTVKMYAKYLGNDIAEGLPNVGIEFPLVFEQNGLIIGRAVIAKHADGSLTFAGNIQVGQAVHFGVGNIETILKHGDENIASLIAKIEHNPEAIFIYACMARRRFLNGYMTEELSHLKMIGDISGFFTYGEFYNIDGKNQLLNESMTLLILSESLEKNHIRLNLNTIKKEKTVLNSQHALAHLANAVSNELAELNNTLEERVASGASIIYKQAYINRLTGLPNRLTLINRLEDCIGQTLILINIDDFTSINDYYGNKIGDAILKSLALLLESLIKDDNAELYKLQADEFAIILNSLEGNVDIKESIMKCMLAIKEKKFIIGEHEIHVSVTMSAALINEQSTGFGNADMALKHAKKSSKEYILFEDELNLSKQYEKNINMVHIIKNAISNDKIFPYYQPIFDVKTGAVLKYEALVRLEQEDGTIMTPYFFLEVSQKIRLYSQITRIMIEKSFSYFSQNGLNFSLNLSFSDILNDYIKAFLFEKIKEYNIASQLTIEILETQANDDYEVVAEFIGMIYAIGAKIAIDDFGSGYANFEHMTKMRSDYMKIDGSLIKNIDTDANARLIVETIVMFAKKLNKTTIAEFVHSKEVLAIVKELDIDLVQGFYLGEPKESVL